MSLFPQLAESILGFALGLPRMLALVSMLPIFAKQQLTGILRTGVTIVLFLPMLPAMTAQAHVSTLSGPGILFLVMKEALLGFLIGFAIAIPFWAADAAGFVIDNQRGASTNSINNPFTEDESSPIGMLCALSYIVIFLAMNGLPMTLELVYRSYQIWPVDAPLPVLHSQFAQTYLDLLGTLVRTAIVWAAPALTMMLLAELGLAMISIFAPQMQVFFLAMPVKSGVALFVLTVYFGTLTHYFGQLVLRLPQTLPLLQGVMR